MALNFLNNGYFGGKLGIGKESPSYSPSSLPDANVLLQIGGDNLGDIPEIRLAGGNGLDVSSKIVFDNDILGRGMSIFMTSDTTPFGPDGLCFFNENGSDPLTNESRVHMKIDRDTGNIGMGTNSPDYKLEVQGVISSADSGLQKATFANVSNDLVLTANADATNVSASLIFKSSASGGGAVTEKMRISSDNSLVLGSSTVGGSKRFLMLSADNAVNYDIDFQQSGTTNHGRIRYTEGAADLEFYPITGVDPNLVLKFNGNSYFQRGNVGIGTTSPDYLLDLYQSTATTSSTTGTTLQRLWNYVGSDLNQQKTFIDFVFQDDNTNEYPQVRIGAEVGQNGNAGSLPLEGSGAFVVYTNNATGDGPGTPSDLAERFRVDYRGNVGIGTNIPVSPLTIKSNSTSSGESGLTVQANANTNAIVKLGEKGGDGGRFEMLDAGVTKIALFTDGTDNYINAGNVGIGVTGPATKLQVVGATGEVVRISAADTTTGAINTGAYISIGGHDGVNARTFGYVGAFKENGTSGNYSGYLSLATRASGGSSTEKLRITSVGAIQFNSYNSTNNTGTPTYLLGTDGSGNIVKTNTVPGSAAGPYLPLTGGTLSGPGNLTVGGTTNLSSTLTVVGVTTLANVGYLGDGLGSVQYTLQSANNGFGTIDFGDVADANIGRLSYSHVDNSFLIRTNNATALTLDSSQNATFAGRGIFSDNVQIVYTGSKTNDAGLYIENDSDDWGIHVNKNTSNFGIRITSDGANAFGIYSDAGQNKINFSGTGSATFAGNVTAPTFIGNVTGNLTGIVTATSSLANGVIAATQGDSDDSELIATTAFVQNLIETIPAGLVFQGTWDARTAAEGGAAGDKGNPALTSGVGTTGHFYIVSNSGSVNLDGITDWVTGDWAVFVEVGATDSWQKIDNSSVLDGSGTGQTVPLWSGSGTSNTLTDSVITQDSTNVGIGMPTVPLHKLDIESDDNSLLKIRNTTNGGGASIEFNDNGTAATTQNGQITYYHSDGSSQGGGSSFWFEAQPDTTLVVGNNTNTGRVVVSGNNVAEVGYGFYDDINTGMYKPTNHVLGFAANGNQKINVSGFTNTSYVADGLWGASATPSWFATTGGGKLRLGYQDNGSGLYASAYGFETTSTDGLGNTFEIRSIVLKNTNSNAYVFEVSNLGSGKFAKGVQIGDDTDTASAAKVGTMRYRTATDEPVLVTGTELVANGDFANTSIWTTSGTVAIASGTANWTNAVNGAGFFQAITFTANAYYKCEVTVSNYSTGTFRFRYPGISSPRVSANGTYSFIIQADQSQNATLYLQGEIGLDANVNFSIDNVSVMEVTLEDASYADMCMQTGASTYEWVNIVRNTY